MGTRCQVKIVEKKGKNVYLYEHWDGYDLPNTVRNALKRGKERWNDTPYLSRIIFSEMIVGSIMNTDGFGISSMPFGDIEYEVIVDPIKEYVKVYKMDYDGKNKELLFAGSFKELINDKRNEW